MKDSLDILLTEPVYVAHDSLDILNPDVICHHGILGMKWGIRRYQNKDGSLTAAGKKRYVKGWEKAIKTKGKKGVERRKETLAGMVNEDEVVSLYKAAYSGNPNLNYGTEKSKIVERLTGEKWTPDSKLHNYIYNDLDYPFEEKKLSKEKLKKLNDETRLEYLNNKAPKGYKLSEWSKDPSKEIIYNKETPKYVLQFKPQQHDDRPSKVHDDFEKNSDKILKQSFDAAYKDIKNRLGEDFNVTKEDFVKYLDKPQVRIIPDWNMAEITSFDGFTNHFPTIEYDLKNKKVLNTSLDG